VVTRKTLGDIALFIAVIIGFSGILKAVLGMNSDLLSNKLVWYVILIVAVFLILVIVYFKLIKKSSPVVVAEEEEQSYIKCPCGEEFSESKIAIMKDFTFKPPKVTRLCPICRNVLEEVKVIEGEQIHVDIIENLVNEKFRYYAILHDVDCIKRFEDMIENFALSRENVVIENFDTKLVNREIVSTFVCGTDKIDLSKMPKTVKAFKVESYVIE